MGIDASHIQRIVGCKPEITTLHLSVANSACGVLVLSMENRTKRQSLEAHPPPLQPAGTEKQTNEIRHEAPEDSNNPYHSPLFTMTVLYSYQVPRIRFILGE